DAFQLLAHVHEQIRPVPARLLGSAARIEHPRHELHDDRVVHGVVARPRGWSRAVSASGITPCGSRSFKSVTSWTRPRFKRRWTVLVETPSTSEASVCVSPWMRT